MALRAYYKLRLHRKVAWHDRRPACNTKVASFPYTLMSSPHDPFRTPEPAFQHFSDSPSHSTPDNLGSSAITVSDKLSDK